MFAVLRYFNAHNTRVHSTKISDIYDLICSSNAVSFTQARYCQERGIDAKRASMMYFWNGIASVLCRALTGYVCDMKGIHPKWIMQVAVFVAGATTALSTLTHSYMQLMTCFVVYGIADGAIISSMNILAMATLSPEQRTQGFGFFHFCVAIALAVGPPFGGMWLFVLTGEGWGKQFP